METRFNPSDHEADISKFWREQEIGKPVDNGKEAFSIVLPPPNATGELHLGHALMLAIEDVMIRYRRLKGDMTVWVPGTDHAAIATQQKVEKLLPEGVTKHDLGREAFLQRVREFVEGSQDTIRKQIDIMGASLDWSRERYTLGQDESKLVHDVFIALYNDGLLHRGQRIVNWDPVMQTTVADDEVEYVDECAPFYYFKYGPFEIGTARPETKFGDKYVVMHPNDERYAQYEHGQKIECEWINGSITATVIKDEAVDPEFGTGVMTITPWHDATDFDIAERHDLDKEQIIDFEGKLLECAGEFAGIHIDEARPKIAEKMKEKGLLVRIDDKYQHRVAVNYRGGAKIEPQIKAQWFVDVEKEAVEWKGKKQSFKTIMKDAVESGDISIIPERFKKTYYHWIDNLRPWCVSRQIWFGHRIPAYFDSKGNISVGEENPDASEWKQDPDTLDTWFSSGMWSFSCFMSKSKDGESLEDWIARSKDTGDLGIFHPTSVLETGKDILFFWVARMILMSSYVMGEIPFKKIYLHGMVVDEQGRKFSKSIGNGIDPRETVKEYGADATRLALLLGLTPGNELRISMSKIEGYRNYATKIWNIARFIQIRLSDAESVGDEKSVADKWIESKLQETIERVTSALEADNISEAGLVSYEFAWHQLADWYLEMIKIPEYKPSRETLEYVLRTLLIILHPFMPFVTEAIWQTVWPGASMAIYNSNAGHMWPVADSSKRNERIESEMTTTIAIIEQARGRRNEHGVPASEKIDMHIDSDKPIHMPMIEKFVRGNIADEKLDFEDVVVSGVRVTYVFPVTADRSEKIEKEKTELDGYIRKLEVKLSDESFISKAPETVVEKEKAKLAEAKEKRAALG